LANLVMPANLRSVVTSLGLPALALALLGACEPSTQVARPTAAEGATPATGGSAAPTAVSGLSTEAEPSVELAVPNADGAGSLLDAGIPAADAAASVPDAGSSLVPGALSVSWMHGAADCAQSTDPELQLHAYNATTFILRQDKCRTYEAPFMYLLLGTDTALLLDTGATTSAGLRDAVAPLVGGRALLVAHTHAHGDHVASDARFRGQPRTTVVGTSLAAVQAAFGINRWPADAGEIDLGGRVLDVLPIPGHEQTHIALYDRDTGLLFTGDTLYPGLLFIEDWTAYRASVQRLAAFVSAHPIAHVLGAHVEMTSMPGVNYAYGTIYQAAEHELELDAAHVLELDAALDQLGPTPPPRPVAHTDFVIDPQ
jgi:glyoxylase-like metal-dependent hydrolase (beta-lactamase superfamily II)